MLGFRVEEHSNLDSLLSGDDARSWVGKARGAARDITHEGVVAVAHK